MGKKAKLKKLRRERKANPETNKTLSSPTQFVEELNQLGYQLEQIERSPEVPNDYIEPKL